VLVNSSHAFPLPTSAQDAGIQRVVYDQATAAERGIRALLADVVNARLATHHDPEKLAKVIMKKIWRG